DVADLARLDQLAERPERLRQRRLEVVEVGVIEVDRLDPEPLQRGVGSGVDRLRPQVVEAGEFPDLGRDDELVALPGSRRQPFADDRLRLAAAVAGSPRHIDVGGVDEVAAGGDVGVEHREGLVAGGGPAEDVAAEAETEDIEIGAGDERHAGDSRHAESAATTPTFGRALFAEVADSIGFRSNKKAGVWVTPTRPLKRNLQSVH